MTPTPTTRKLSPAMQTVIDAMSDGATLSWLTHGSPTLFQRGGKHTYVFVATVRALKERGLISLASADYRTLEYDLTDAGRAAASKHAPVSNLAYAAPADALTSAPVTYTVTADQFGLLCEMKEDHDAGIRAWDGLLDLASPENKRDLRTLYEMGLVNWNKSGASLSADAVHALRDGRITVSVTYRLIALMTRETRGEHMTADAVTAWLSNRYHAELWAVEREDMPSWRVGGDDWLKIAAQEGAA